MVGDTADYVKLVALVKKKKALEVPPGEFIGGGTKSDDSGADLDDDTQICSCHVSTDVNFLRTDMLIILPLIWQIECFQGSSCAVRT
jgi:hypothetical protein